MRRKLSDMETLLYYFMPNDCSNYLVIDNLLPEEKKQILQTFKGKDGYQRDFLKTYVPEPDWKNIPYNVAGDLPFEETLGKGENAYTSLSIKDPDDPTKSTQDRRWYEWRKENWGTKWDVYDPIIEEEPFVELTGPSNDIGVNFMTAWSPPNEKCLSTISKQFPNAVFINRYDELSMDYFGVTVAQNGITFEEDGPDPSNIRDEWAQLHEPELFKKANDEDDLDAQDELEEIWCDQQGDELEKYWEEMEQTLLDYLRNGDPFSERVTVKKDSSFGDLVVHN